MSRSFRSRANFISADGGEVAAVMAVYHFQQVANRSVMEREKELAKLINVLRRTSRMALQSEWTGGKEDAAAFCTDQYNRVLARLKELDAGTGVRSTRASSKTSGRSQRASLKTSASISAKASTSGCDKGRKPRTRRKTRPGRSKSFTQRRKGYAKPQRKPTPLRLCVTFAPLCETTSLFFKSCRDSLIPSTARCRGT